MKKIRPETNTLATTIRAVRKRLNKSQEEMAHALNKSVSGYQKWEQGKAAPGGPDLLRLIEMAPADLRGEFTPGLSGSAPQQDGQNTSEPEYVKSAPADMARRYRALVKEFQFFQSLADAGNHAAQEGLRALAEMWSHSAFVVSSPDRPKGRKKKLAEDFLRRMSDVEPE